MHWKEYLAEMLGTVILMFFGTSAIIINFGNDSFIRELIPDEFARLFLAGSMFAGTASLVAVSPLGKMSGGHINPAISLSFWILRMMPRRDLGGYLIFQFVGAAIGSAAAMQIWADEFSNVNSALTLPGSGISAFEAFLAEIVMTFILAISILVMLSHHGTARFTPVMVWMVITLEVLFGAPISGTSINPARSFGPAVVTNLWEHQWIYLTAPVIGALLAATAYHARIFGTMKLKTVKLFHSSSYRCTFLSCRICGKKKD